MPSFKRATTWSDDPRGLLRRIAAAAYMGLAVAMLFGSQFLLNRLGASVFAATLAGVFGGVVFAIVSFRYLSVPFLLWIVSICGFRFIFAIRTPILPDLYLDRMAMIWLAIVFLIKYVAQRKPFRGPFLLDVLLLVHALYLLGQVFLHKMEYFGVWTTSILIPYSVYFFAKNLMTEKRQIRALLWVLFALSVYYNVTSVAEKFHINALLWPKYMVNADAGWAGRSLGPFLQAPLFGTVIGIMLPVHLYFLATVKGTAWRLMLAASFLLGLAGLYFTYTRGSWLAGVVALALTAFLNRKAYMRYLLPAAIVAPVVAIGVLGLAQDKFMKDRMENEATIGSRLGTAVTVMRVWRDHPIFGVGFFQYAHVREDYVAPVEIAGFQTIHFWQFRRNSIHDIYLGPMAETGIVGMCLQYAIYFAMLRVFLRKYFKRRDDDEVAGYVIPVFAGLMAGYLVGGLAIDYRFFAVISTLFMLGAGVIDGHQPPARVEGPVTG